MLTFQTRPSILQSSLFLDLLSHQLRHVQLPRKNHHWKVLLLRRYPLSQEKHKPSNPWSRGQTLVAAQAQTHPISSVNFTWQLCAICIWLVLHYVILFSRHIQAFPRVEAINDLTLFWFFCFRIYYLSKGCPTFKLQLKVSVWVTRTRLMISSWCSPNN